MVRKVKHWASGAMDNASDYGAEDSRKVTKLSVIEMSSGAKVATGTHRRVYGTQPKH